MGSRRVTNSLTQGTVQRMAGIEVDVKNRYPGVASKDIDLFLAMSFL